MKKFIKRIFDFFLGIHWSIGFVMVVWFICSCFFTMPPFSSSNICFVLVSCAIPWLLNFIFSYSSYLYVKGILHGVVWFVLEMILFNLVYGIALDASVLLICAGVFAAGYALVLWLFSKASEKLNMPVRRTAEFLAKLSAMIDK